MNAKQRKTLGITLFIISLIFWFILFSLPLLPYKGKVLITIGTICLILGEVLFYLSVFVLGRELYAKYKTQLNPRNWRKKTNQSLENPKGQETEKDLPFIKP
jgi:hypothetical protein